MENYDNTPQNNAPAVTPGLAGLLGLIVVLTLTFIGGALLTLIIVGTDFNSADGTSLKLINSAAQILFMLLPALLLGRAIYYDLTKLIRARKPRVKDLFIFSTGMIVLIFLIQPYTYLQTYIFNHLAEGSAFLGEVKALLDQMNKVVEKSFKAILGYKNAFDLILSFVAITFVPAICEEVFFRGYLQRSFELKWTPFKGALITAVIFGVFHLNFYGLLPLIAIGLFLGYSLYKTNSIVVPMVLHFLNNALSFAAYMIYGEEELTISQGIDPEILGSQIFMFVLLLSLFFLFIFFVNKHYKNTTTV
ncbi:MAG: type II CAAX prenyl endopeptidase Rce1 family protein [Rhodothermaceae bacterium]